MSGTITMTKKGGAFDRGAIQVDGVLSAADRTQFETALRKFSGRKSKSPILRADLRSRVSAGASQPGFSGRLALSPGNLWGPERHWARARLLDRG